MPRSLDSGVPSYRHHKPTGQAVVTLSGKDYYLSKWNTPASRAEYDRLTGEWLAAGRSSPVFSQSDLSVAEVALRYWRFAQSLLRQEWRSLSISDHEPMQFDSKVLEFVADRISRRHDELAAKQSYLIDCLAQLSEFRRQVIRLYYTLGLTAKVVADKLGRNVAAVEKTLVRTRRTLHECVEAAMRREERI